VAESNHTPPSPLAMLWAAKYYVWRSQVAVVVLVLILNLMSSARASPTSSEHSQNEKFSRPLKHKADEVMEARDRIKRGISDEEFSDFVEGTGKMVRPERYSFGLGKRSGGDGGDEMDSGDVMVPEKKDPYTFGLGKREPYTFGLGKREPYAFGLGKRAPYEFGLGKRAPYEFGLGKREPYAFGLGKREPYAFGLGKREPYAFGLGKRDGNYAFGLGKRDPYAFGLGKREPYGFGLGKRRPYGFGLGR